MTIISSPLSRFAPFLLLPLLMAPLSGLSAAPQKPRAAPSAPAPVAVTSDIVALPLNPTLPAGQRLCSAKTEAGLGYMMLRPAAGAKPTEADYVLVNYVGYLAATGMVFDQGMRAAFPVNGVIPGFSKGLQMMAKGAVARFCIPAAMGYGERDAGQIPPNSDLVFQVELVDYKTAAEIEALNKASEVAPTPAAPAEATPAP